MAHLLLTLKGGEGKYNYKGGFGAEPDLSPQKITTGNVSQRLFIAQGKIASLNVAPNSQYTC